MPQIARELYGLAMSVLDDGEAQELLRQIRGRMLERAVDGHFDHHAVLPAGLVQVKRDYIISQLLDGGFGVYITTNGVVVSWTQGGD